MKEVKIGSQVWAQEDLKVTKFRNGEEIPRVDDNQTWSQLETAAYCVNERGNFLYNWYAVDDPRGLAPEGWAVPSDKEWTTLTDELGGASVAGHAMKSSMEWDGSNTSGFNGLPSGNRNYYGGFYNFGYDGCWWSSSPAGSNAWYRRLNSYYEFVNRNNYYQRNGFSVRCIKRDQ